MSGELATQTPPWPTAIPEGIFRPSAKTVNRSALPSPSVSSRTLIRSRPGPGRAAGIFEALGDPDPAALVEGHRDRVDDVGLGGDQLDLKAGRDGHRPDRLGRRSRRVRAPVLAVRNRLRGLATGLRNGRSRQAIRFRRPATAARVNQTITIRRAVSCLFLDLHECCGSPVVLTPGESRRAGSNVRAGSFSRPPQTRIEVCRETLWLPSLVLALYQNRHAPDSRFVQMATVRADGRPANRTLVFRGFLNDTPQLTFVTDARSTKVAELRTSALVRSLLVLSRSRTSNFESAAR